MESSTSVSTENDHNRMAPPVRDQLAIDRTILSNERTMLAYMRTALTLLIVSVAFIKFIESVFIVIVGILLIPISVATALVGLLRYQRRRATITRLYGHTPLAPPGVPTSVDSRAEDQSSNDRDPA